MIETSFLRVNLAILVKKEKKRKEIRYKDTYANTSIYSNKSKFSSG